MTDVGRGKRPGVITALTALGAFVPWPGMACASNGEEGRSGKSETGAEYALELTKAIRAIGSEHITLATKAQMVRWPVRGLYRALRGPIPADIASRLKGLENAGQKDIPRLLRDARARLGAHKELEKDGDFELSLQAIFAELEPAARPSDRSRYIRADKVSRFRLGGPVANRCGVGLKLERDPTGGMLRVQTPILNSPAYKAGLRAGDLVTHIRIDTDSDGKSLPKPLIISTKGLSVERAAELLLGMPSTRVVLTAIPAGATKPHR